MQVEISHRMSRPDFPSEFLASILKSNSAPNLIKFGGGLPNELSFPVEEMEAAADKVLQENGVIALQYSGAQGYAPLRKFIADRYKKQDIDVDESEIIITNGSQQALNIFSAVMLNHKDRVLVENPTYLAALQVFNLFDADIVPLDLNADGIDVSQLAEKLSEKSPKFIYLIPNFQNPTGLTYSDEVRESVAEVLRKNSCMVLEDNPYGDLRFSGKAGHSFGWYLGKQCCMLGTFSKTVSPGMRIGWITCKQKDIFEKMLTCKSTLDLHTNMFCQMVLHQYLQDNDFDAHIASTCELYRQKAALMLSCIEKYCPEGVHVTRPEGGMFMWVTLPEGVSGVDVQNAALKEGVSVSAGDPFYAYERNVNKLRLNFTSCSDELIDEGIRILGEVIRNI